MNQDQDHKIYVSPNFGEELIFKPVQSAEAGTGSSVDLLSNRDLEVLQLLGKGVSMRSIAEKLHLSVKTIETHGLTSKRSKALGIALVTSG